MLRGATKAAGREGQTQCRWEQWERGQRRQRQSLRRRRKGVGLPVLRGQRIERQRQQDQQRRLLRRSQGLRGHPGEGVLATASQRYLTAVQVLIYAMVYVSFVSCHTF